MRLTDQQRRLLGAWMFVTSTSCAPFTRVAAQALDGEIAGSWQVVLTGSMRARLPMEFVVERGAKHVRGYVLSGANIQLTDGVWHEGILRMKAATTQGAMKLEAHVEGDRLIGTWSSDNVIGQFFLKGNLAGERYLPEQLAPITGESAGDMVWNVIRQRFYEPSFNGVDWWALHAEYLTQLRAARTNGEVATIVNALLRRLKSSHVDFAPQVRTVVPRANAVASDTAQVVSWRMLSPKTGYIRIASFPADSTLPRAIAQLDSAMAELHGLANIIIDLRNNPGGSLDLGSRLAQHVLERPMDIGYFVSQEGLRHYAVPSIADMDPKLLPRLAAGDAVIASSLFASLEKAGGAAMLVAGGGKAHPFVGRLAVLINGATGSTAEAVAAALQENQHATLFGARSAGAMLASTQMAIAPGWLLRYPEYDYRTARGVKVEGVGVTPEVIVADEKTGDATLERAVAYLEGLRRTGVPPA